MNGHVYLLFSQAIRALLRSGLHFAGAIFVMSLMSVAVSAQDQNIREAGQPVPFDIPSQPLANALKAYADIASVELFYDSTIMANRLSAPVRGVFDPAEALRLMLEGTGLTATSLIPKTVTILPDQKSQDRRDLSEIKARTSPFLPYLGQVQEGVRAALCKGSAGRTDSTEGFVRLWIASSGAVSHVDFFSQSGLPVSTPAYAATLERLAFEEPPPDMPQPIIMMLLPRPPSGSAGCDHE